MTSAVIFLAKSCPGSFMLILEIEKSVSALRNEKSIFCLLIIGRFLNFPSIPLIFRAEQIGRISGNFQMLKFF